MLLYTPLSQTTVSSVQNDIYIQLYSEIFMQQQFLTDPEFNGT